MKHHHNSVEASNNLRLSKNYDNNGSIGMKRRKSTDYLTFNGSNVEYIDPLDALKLFKEENNSSELPSHNVMFPWLYSIANNSVQKPDGTLDSLLFMRSKNSCCPKNETIGNSGILKSSIDPKDIFISIDDNDFVNDCKNNIHLINLESKYKFVREVLFKTLDVNESGFLKNDSLTNIDNLIATCIKFNIFPFLKTDCNILEKLKTKETYVANSVSNNIQRDTVRSSTKWKQSNIFRRFDLQCSKSFELSKTVILYCFHNDHSDTNIITPHSYCDNCYGLLILLKIAINFINISYQKGSNNKMNNNNLVDINIMVMKYNTLSDIPKELIAIEPMNIKTLKKKPNQLLSEFDIATFNCWETNISYHEKLEITKLTSISKIDESSKIWAGNLTDFHIYQLLSKLKVNNDESEPDVNKIIRKRTDFNCIDLKTICTIRDVVYNHQHIHLNDSGIFNIPKLTKPICLFINCFEHAPLPTMKDVCSAFDKLNNAHDKQVHYMFPSSGSIGLGNLNISSINIILNTCYMIYYLSEFHDVQTLFYCANGYTETSFLLVAYLIFYWNLPLEKTMLKLHLKYDRSFFLFHSDLQVLGHLQLLLQEFSPNKEVNFMKYKQSFNANKSMEPLEITPEMFSKIFFIQVPPESDFSKIKGPFPSKILPHLYLGSLEHTQSNYLLKQLGINYIISVGETITWLEDDSTDIYSRKRGISNPIPNPILQATNVRANGLRRATISKQINSYNKSDNSSWSEIIEKDGFKILKINNLLDNGQDTISDQLDEALEFIDECYQKKGKVLVHCMVGVSRSASVCIAECIKRLNCNLLQAYLYVRARRLNIIIQPTLMFMYDLLKWRQAKHHEDKDDWHILCRSIHELNSKYI
ncbi:hypothetical protein TPHA_0I02700 [Tetrapisispora phaffii CBS 4417]|uniref:Uncharacterized protein n=1 Tax=Tetrapisispora phaffii (strain ATCC 24235 / CBS 4417 / NBRC 1672 / NRRL Y-8282 / UCD 70-5) TaxID=1071381 RepID=G8BXZ3_TETPH|nr:hypothetical protein TPHA_0I02700 [Tetrapisispora phaffii CBS 4417]CCE64771.1 hypothetical protein TPHA_0I02700 [Tetrapisispora phaffii CBS 4417]